MSYREVELLAVGAGPANLALAVALEEMAPDGLARDSLIIERADSVRWQRGLLLPWTRSQVSFLKDLVTRRNPNSRFSFLNYLHATGRLDDFINMGSIHPYRTEISGYLSWVAESLQKVRVELGRACAAIRPRRGPDGLLTGWIAQLADGSEIGCRYLVLGTGRDPYTPPVFAGLPASKVIHSTQYVPRVADLDRDLPYRVAIVGGGQSAAEMFRAIQNDLPYSDISWIMRSIGPVPYETGKFNNQLYFPSFVDEFFAALPAARAQILQEMHRTNYSGVDEGLLAALYEDLYLDRLAGADRKRLVTMAEVTAADDCEGEAVLQLTDLKTGSVTAVRRDLIFLGTGFVKQMPGTVSGLTRSLGLTDPRVNRCYRLILDEPAMAACYLQGVNEATHGIADSLLSVLASRAGDIVSDLAADFSGQATADVRPASRVSVSVPGQ